MVTGDLSYISSTVEHSLLGHLYSRDTSIYQGTQNLAQACKMFYLLPLFTSPFNGKGHFF